MAGKRGLCLRRLSPVLGFTGRRVGRSLLLALVTALLCVALPLLWASLPAVGQSSAALVTQAQDWTQQGRQLYEAGRVSEAAVLLRQVAENYQVAGDFARQAEALNLLGRLQLEQGQTEDALETWQQAEASFNRANQPNGVNRSRINQAEALRILGFYPRALETLERVLNGQPDRPLRVVALRLKGELLQLTGDSRSPETATPARQALQASLAEAQSPIERAAAQLSLGHLERLNLERDRVAQTVQNLVSQGANLSADGIQASLQSALQPVQVVLTLYQEAASANTPTTPQAQVSQVNLLVETTLPFLNGLQQIDRQAKTQGSNLSLLRTQLVGQATPLLNQTRDLLLRLQPSFDRTPPNRPLLNARINLADSLLKYEQARQQDIQTRQQERLPPAPLPALRPYPEIGQLLAGTVEQARRLKDGRTESYAIGTLGHLYEVNQQWQEAQKLTEQALQLAQASSAPEITYRWQWQLGRILVQTGDLKGANLAYGAAVQNLQALRSDLVAISPEAQFNFRDSVEPIYRQSVEVLLKSLGSDPKANEAKLEEARRRIEALQLAELDNYFRQACLEGRFVALDNLVDQQNPTTAIFYPIVLPDRLQVIVKIPNQPLQLHTEALPQVTVERTLRELRRTVVDPDEANRFQQLAQQVYGWLITPVEANDRLKHVNTLVFVMDGAFRNIPIAALSDGKQYLIQKYAVSLSLGLQLLDPKPLSQAPLNILAAGLQNPQPPFQEKYAPLPGIATEFNLIRQLKVPARFLQEQEFNKSALRQAVQRTPFNVLHLATHGNFSSQPGGTYVLAYDGQIDVNQLGELLRNREQISDEAIELLVLSACQTVQGDQRAVLGIAGFALRSGARSTLASLWRIDDEATSEMIGTFYEELTSRSATKAAALQKAQLKLINDGKTPDTWAPYVLVGNWL